MWAWIVVIKLNSFSEPGYYKTDAFGIRIENIVRVVKAKTAYNHNDTCFLTFIPTTMVPIQTSLLDTSLLTQSEVSREESCMLLELVCILLTF